MFYKFRVYYDEVEDFVRDIEILANDSFESFHRILLSSIGLDGQELSSFFICDSKWNKQKEISLMDMKDDEVKEEPVYEDDDEFSLRSRLPISVMKDSLLKDFVTNPHQKMMYEYDFLNPKVFYIELLKVLKEEEGVTYPRCTNKVKDFPKEMKNFKLPNPDDGYEEFADSNDDYDADLDNDFEDGYDDLDMSGFDEFKEY